MPFWDRIGKLKKVWTGTWWGQDQRGRSGRASERAPPETAEEGYALNNYSIPPLEGPLLSFAACTQRLRLFLSDSIDHVDVIPESPKPRNGPTSKAQSDTTSLAVAHGELYDEIRTLHFELVVAQSIPTTILEITTVLIRDLEDFIQRFVAKSPCFEFKRQRRTRRHREISTETRRHKAVEQHEQLQRLIRSSRMVCTRISSNRTI